MASIINGIDNNLVFVILQSSFIIFQMNRSQLSQFQNSKTSDQMRFRKVKKIVFQSQSIESNKQNKQNGQSNVFLKHSNSPQKNDNLYEQNRLLKQQNMHLKQLIKTQKTKLLHMKEQQRAKLFKEENFDQSKLIRKKYFQLKQAFESMKEEFQATKKSFKATKIKELQNQTQQCYQQIKRLNAMLKNTTKNNKKQTIDISQVAEINKIIESEYFLTLENKELKNLNQDQKQEIQKQIKIIRKLKNVALQRQKRIDQLVYQAKQHKQKKDKKISIVQMVPKNELDKKKKDIIVLTQAIALLEKKVLSYQVKIQQIKKEQIQVINRQNLKRKQLMSALEKLQKSKQALEQALVNIKKKTQINRANPSTIRNEQSKKIELDLQDFSQPFKKKKHPQIVQLQHISNTIQLLIFNLQKKGMDSDTAIKELISDFEVINISQIQYMLQNDPFNINSPQERQIFARYLIQANENESIYIEYDYFQGASVVKSILKRIFNNFSIFSEEDQTNLRIKAQQYQKNAQFNIRAALVNKKDKSAKGINEFQRDQIIDAINSDQKIDQKLFEFIKFRTYQLRNKKVSLSQFFKFIYQNKENVQ